MEAESGICDGREHLLTRGRNTLVQKDLHCGPEAQNSTAYFMYVYLEIPMKMVLAMKQIFFRRKDFT